MNGVEIKGSSGHDNIVIYGGTRITVDTKDDKNSDKVYVHDSDERKSHVIKLNGDRFDKLIDKR